MTSGHQKPVCPARCLRPRGMLVLSEIVSKCILMLVRQMIAPPHRFAIPKTFLFWNCRNRLFGSTLRSVSRGDPHLALLVPIDLAGDWAQHLFVNGRPAAGDRRQK